MDELFVLVKGDVTGVGFRAWVAEQARALQLTGWVRNGGIGVVEAVFQGNESELRRMLAIAGQGPDAATVDSVEDFWRESSQAYTNFVVY